MNQSGLLQTETRDQIDSMPDGLSLTNPFKKSDEGHAEKVRDFFESVANDPDLYDRHNKYYWKRCISFHKSVIPPNSDVLELGCYTGRLLHALEPKHGVGVDISPQLINIAKETYPDLDFEVADAWTYQNKQKFDYVIMHDLLDYVDDIQAHFHSCHRFLKDRGILAVTTMNPLWEPMLNFASKMGIRRPEFPQRNYITNEDVKNFLELAGFQILFSGYRCICPVNIPLLAPFLNHLVPHIPFFRYFCSTQFILATPYRKRKEYSFSVVIPCLNEAGNIKHCVESVPRVGSRTEVIVVDDGSTDGTAEQARSAVNEHCDVRVISYSPNRGKREAVKAGFEAATGDILTILDADMTVRAHDLYRFYEPLASGYADFGNGTRAIYPMDERAMKFSNYLGNKAFSMLVSWLMDQRVSDTLCGTKTFFKEDYRHFDMGHDPWGDFDLLFGIARQRRRIVDIPVHYKERVAGMSKMKSFTHGINLLKACWHGFKSVKLQGH